ncbi:uncharacterized protein LOC142337656 isoform X3 [Convolutriloba macropyga]|uniref:uncharacterized protein LOC142337656 isoform X3 n=1 Tax=Convolutriloba macropyga TaxID=536237 RepID=UPI003F527741
MLVAVVTHKYDAANPDELTIVPGDVIKECQPVEGESGWMTGVLKGRKGLFPDNFVKIKKETTETVATPRKETMFIPTDDNEYDLAGSNTETPKGNVVEVITDFVAVKPGQMNVSKGDKVKVIHTDLVDPKWLHGELKSSKGVFPTSCVRPESLSISSSEDTPSTSKPATEAVTSSAPVEMDKKFIVKHKYEAAQKDELQLKPGDIIQMLEDVEPGWALGKVNGKTGLYPTNFVAPFEESTRPPAVKTSSGGKRSTDTAFKSNSKKDSDQHKQDFKTEASDDEIDGAVVSVSKDIASAAVGGKGDKGGGSSLNKNKSASQSSLDDILGETSPSHTGERKEKKSGGIGSALKKIRPKHKQTASDISGDSKSAMKSSQSGENLSPTSTSQTGGGKGNSSSSKMNKSMESVNSVEDEHENVSRESASSNELLSEIGKSAVVNGGTSSSPTSVVVSPEPTGIILPDNMFPAIEIDAMGVSDTVDHPQGLGVAKKGLPRQTNKRLPSRDKIRQNAETAETDRAQAMESTAVLATSTAGSPSSEDTVSDLPPRDSRVRVGPPIGAVGGNRFGGVALPGGKDLLSQLKNRQSAINSASSPAATSPQTSAKPISSNNTTSSSATPPAPSSVAEARRSFAPGPGAPPPAKPTKPFLSGARPLSTVPQSSSTQQHSTTTATLSANPPQLLSAHSTPALSSAPQSLPLTDISHKQQQQINIPPTAPTVVPVAGAYTLSSSSSPAPSQQASNPQPSTVATNPSMMVSTGAAPPGIGPKPSRPPPPQVPDKPRDFSAAGAASFEAELRTVKDTVTRLERRIKELEGQLEQEQESRRRLEAKVDALVKSK